MPAPAVGVHTRFDGMLAASRAESAPSFRLPTLKECSCLEVLEGGWAAEAEAASGDASGLPVDDVAFDGGMGRLSWREEYLPCRT